MMNDELKTKAFQFIIHHSSFIICFYGSGAVVFQSGAIDFGKPPRRFTHERVVKSLSALVS
jgi:hypothetical protein